MACQRGPIQSRARSIVFEEEKTPQGKDIFQTPEAKEAQGLSLTGGGTINLCPEAFKEPVPRTIPVSLQIISTSLVEVTSTGEVLLHEVTHSILNSRDIRYKANGVILMARLNGGEAQHNADTWTYYAMASLLGRIA